MRRFFVKNILFVITVNILVKPIWVFFIDRVVQNRVGTAEYGTFSPLLSMSIIFSIILDFGITNYNSRTISQNPDKLTTLFGSMLAARIVLMLVYMVVVSLIEIVSGCSWYEIMLLFGILLFQSFNFLLQFIRSNVAALQRFKTDGVLSVIDRFLMIIVCGFLLLNPGTARSFRIEWFVIVQIVCYFTACIIAYTVLRHIHDIKLRLSFHAPTIFRIIRESFPYALFIFLMSLYIRSDMQMIRWIAGASESGVYAASYRLLDVSINMFGSMFAAVLLPLFGRMLAQKQEVNQIVTLCVNIMLPISLMVSVAAAFFGVPVMHLLYPATTARWATIFAWVMAAFPGFCIMYVYSTLLTANGDLKVLNMVAGAGALFNILLNTYLISHKQALGAAITCALTESLTGIGYIVFCVKKLNVHVPFRWAMAHLGFLCFVAGLAYAATLLPLMWIYQVVLFAVAGILFMFLFRFVSVKNIKQLIQPAAA